MLDLNLDIDALERILFSHPVVLLVVSDFFVSVIGYVRVFCCLQQHTSSGGA